MNKHQAVEQISEEAGMMGEISVGEYDCEFDGSLRRMTCQIENRVSDKSDSSVRCFVRIESEKPELKKGER